MWKCSMRNVLFQTGGSISQVVLPGKKNQGSTIRESWFSTRRRQESSDPRLSLQNCGSCFVRGFLEQYGISHPFDKKVSLQWNPHETQSQPNLFPSQLIWNLKYKTRPKTSCASWIILSTHRFPWPLLSSTFCKHPGCFPSRFHENPENQPEPISPLSQVE